MPNPAIHKDNIQKKHLVLIPFLLILFLSLGLSNTVQNIFHYKIKQSLNSPKKILFISTKNNQTYNQGDKIYFEINHNIYKIEVIKSINNKMIISENNIMYSMSEIDGKIIYSIL